jgi:hypothetical protein
LQYFFMSLFDMPELLAFCCAMQSFICAFLAAWSLLLMPLLMPLLVLLVLLVSDGAVELGYWLDGMVPAGGADCWAPVCAMATPATPRITNANIPDNRFMGPC